MALLLQQELMEPPPSRVLHVPDTRTTWWGIDPSTKRVALAWTDGERRGVIMRPIPPCASAHRLTLIHEITGVLVARAFVDGGPPGITLIEQPSGKVQSPELLYAVGVTIASVYSHLVAYGIDLPTVETCASAWWKKRACGRGDIYKPKTHEDRQYGVLTWAQANGYQGSSWDEADAWGIAEAARRDVELAH